MTGIIIEFMIVLIGLAATVLLFYRIPALGSAEGTADMRISVIIPARNEADKLPLLLKDLECQTLRPYEIICVDDASMDDTAKVAAAQGVRLISLLDKPLDWTGKTWACQNGANAASGEVLLFLDADVRLGKDALRKLALAYTACGCTVSAQPFHRPEKAYEQFSLFFNLIQIAANGLALPKPLYIGLYGPAILISRVNYNAIGGHQSVKGNVVEDMALGARLKAAGLPYRLFLGDGDIAFRMYAGGFKSLLQGWVKNIATGAAKTPYWVFLMAFFWIASLISVPIQGIKAAAAGNTGWVAVYVLLYAMWVAILFFISRRAGRFHPLAMIAYPVPILLFLGVFIVSLIKKIFGLRVSWKGRVVAGGKRPCG